MCFPTCITFRVEPWTREAILLGSQLNVPNLSDDYIPPEKIFNETKGNLLALHHFRSTRPGVRWDSCIVFYIQNVSLAYVPVQDFPLDTQVPQYYNHMSAYNVTNGD
jgi:hypothetical protein